MFSELTATGLDAVGRTKKLIANFRPYKPPAYYYYYYYKITACALSAAINCASAHNYIFCALFLTYFSLFHR